MSVERHTEMFRAAAAADPGRSVALDATAIADLAFGSMSVDITAVEGRHLAMLSTESLELDLDDPLQRQFGDYELLELIGEGGMGVVYRAHQASLDREVAVKLLAAGPWASRSFIERFQREAQNAARMQHPNIVAIYEVGSNEELHFFSMRLIRGGSLADLIKNEGKLEPQRAARLLRTIAEAVDYAHRLGVLHLDLKPANVLLDDNAAPHVADFGLARRLEQGFAADTNEVSGTPSYMAPEQCLAAQKVTPATDIWGLGALLYELVTGRPPYLGVTPQATLQLVVNEPLASPREHEKKLPRDLDAIIRKCMAHDASLRYASAGELADDLARFQNGYMVKARALNTLQRSARWARREPKIVAAVVLALLAMLIGLVATTAQWKRAEVERHVAQEQTQRAQKNQATSDARLWQSRRNDALRLQTDGKAFDALPALIANIEEQEKAGTPAAIERREVGMILHQGVTLIDRMIIADASPLTAALSPDGSLLAVGLNDVSVRWYDTATLTERGRLDLLDQPTSDGTPRAPRLLRFVDNHRLRVTLDWFDYLIVPAETDTILVDLDHAQVVTPPSAFSDLANAIYSADGRYALLFDRKRIGQFWQVDPWRPLSPAAYRSTDMSAATPWLLGRDGQALLHFRQSMTGLTVADPRRPQNTRMLAALANVRITAWQESHDGKHFAIGDEDGDIYLLDLKTLQVQTLRAPSGSMVTWVAFSEDDAWCAAARHDGDAFAFEVASGNTLHSGSLQHDYELRYVALSHRDNLLLASGAGESTLWRMPEQGPRGGGTDATRILANPTRSARAGVYWAGDALQAGLLVTADMDGEVRLWRLPADPVLKARAANRITDRTAFDGAHVADVAYDHVRVATVTGRESTHWVQLPQPVSFAELVNGGKTLAAVAGHTLYAFDAATMRSRYAVELQATPINVTISPDGALAVLAFGHDLSTGFELRLQEYELATGQMRSVHANVQGPIRQLEFSSDGERLLSVGPFNGATEVFDAGTLHRIGVYPHQPDVPVIWADFIAHSTSVWMVERGLGDADAENVSLLRWDAQTNNVLEKRALQGSVPIGVRTLGPTPLLATRDNIVLDPGGAAEKTGALLHGGEVTATFAVTADQRLIAHAWGRNVQLYDAATLDPIGPSLPVNWRIMDAIIHLSFDAPGEHLLARLGASWRLVAWPLRADDRPVDALRRDADLLTPAPRARRVLRMADAAEHAWLRSRDPGPALTPAPRPAFAVTRYVDGAPVPQRSPDASPLLLDLTNHYTVTQSTIRTESDTVLIDTDDLPAGVVRLDGIDYDSRGGVELRAEALAGSGTRMAADLKDAARGIAVPPIPIAAFHVLLYVALPEAEPNERTYANVRLHYRDGSQAVLPIRTQREVPGMTLNDRPTPIGWAVSDLASVGVLPIQIFSNPRLLNPHPERIIASLDLETAPVGWSEPVFIAVTAEPVIAGADSGSSKARVGVK